MHRLPPSPFTMKTILGTICQLGISVTAFALAGQALGAQIAELTAGPLAVTRGDVVTIEAIADDASSKIEWWIGGKKACEKSKCEIDTTMFSPGEYIYTVIAHDDDGISTAQVSLSATVAKPLYSPIKIDTLSSVKAGTVTTINRSEWMIVAYSGAITYPNKKVLEKISRIKGLDRAHDDVIYSVINSAQAIVRKVGRNDQWLVSSGSTFRFKNNVFELISGRGQWRRLHEDSPSPALAVVAGARIESKGGLLLFADIGIGSDGVQRAIVSPSEIVEGQIHCGSETANILEPQISRSFTIGKDGKCQKIDAEKFEAEDPSQFAATWSPWWFKKIAPSTLDRWRVEWDLVDPLKPEGDLLARANAAFLGHYCADALDLLGPRQENKTGGDKILTLIGDCQFSLGMYKASLAFFERLESRYDDLSWNAFMIARSNQMLGRHDKALDWFDTAERRDFKDRVELGRLASKSALELDYSRERLRWLETMTLLETDEGRGLKNLEISDQWRTNRPRGAKVGGRMFMDGQALPINSKKVTTNQTTANSSRSVVYGFDGEWWLSRKITNESRLKLSGVHSLTTPYDRSLSFATKMMNLISLAMEIGNHETVGALAPDRWVFDVAGHLGTGITGGARQRDRFGWSLGSIRPKWRNLTFGILSDKYLDPLPGGTDVLDIDLDRYTGDADHSHLDLIFYSGLSAQMNRFNWLIRAEYGNVDYRTGVLDQYDHRHIKALCDFSWLLSRSTTFVVNPSLTSKTYKDAGGTDQTTLIHTGFRFRTAPLWTTSLDASLEKRSVSKDETSSWMRHTYGFGLSADL